MPFSVKCPQSQTKLAKISPPSVDDWNYGIAREWSGISIIGLPHSHVIWISVFLVACGQIFLLGANTTVDVQRIETMGMTRKWSGISIVGLSHSDEIWISDSLEACWQFFLLVPNTTVDGINKWKLNQSPGVYNKTLSWTSGLRWIHAYPNKA
jgi:hypothetical protein